ncbi:hypothetical protein C2857_006970 [Epichloe festucae Fl1]|uniref:BHLH domain-containing protein n=1 Tax=Epichloe festucae (strain Fl1) TaxID=877507 RepID=A0A7S9KTT8_EPIFF|nr:hypothetical protein C2857_006970 [Epichloe festucae Fl1]
MLATQAMSADPTRQELYSDFNHFHFHHRPASDARNWPELPEHQQPYSRSSRALAGQFKFANQMNFLVDVNTHFSYSQAPSYAHSERYRQDDEIWATDEATMHGSHSLSGSPPLPPSSLPHEQQSQGYPRPNDDDAITDSTARPNVDQGGGVDHADVSNSPVEDEPMQSPCFPIGHMRHQSSMDFEEDLLRNSHDTVNENIFADWAWGRCERPTSTSSTHGSSVEWGAESTTFVTPRGSIATEGDDDAVDSRLFPHARFAESREGGVIPRGGPSPPQRVSPNDLYKLKTGTPATLGDHHHRQAAWTVLRTRTSPVDGDVLSTYRAMSLEYLGSALHDQRGFATVGPRREKLTEEQKRRNHILHEKKRRALIKDGFDDLLKLVPDVKDRGLSKSGILLKAAEWLEALISGNKTLGAQARSLDGVAGVVEGAISSRISSIGDGSQGLIDATVSKVPKSTESIAQGQAKGIIDVFNEAKEALSKKNCVKG